MDLNESYWMTKDGRKLKMRDMTTDHLRNAFWMMKRKRKLLSSNTFNFDYDESVLALQDFVERCDEIIAQLQAELEYRGEEATR